ncbi:hypothetical protein [Altererythrobacter sp. Z27]|uniref:hypothetical protein n=1 Tax=Altererythrobacter sp. Z27 TaxID=3461147 RepID=UPI00404428BE
MPLANAHRYLIVMLGLTLWAFWPGYLSNLPAGKSAWHVHAAGALLWAVLVIVQSWSIHNGKRAFHKTVGLASFVAFPLFLVGGVMAIYAETVTLAAGLHDPENFSLGQFGTFDPLANIGFAVLFYGGLKARRNVQLHARYMVATTLFLVAPIVFRLLEQHVPGFSSDTPETAYRFSYAMGVGNIAAFVIAIYLYRLAPKHGRPFLVAAGFIAAQGLGFETLGRVESFHWLFSRFSLLSEPWLIVATFVASVAIIWHGWNAGGAAGSGAKGGGAPEAAQA